MELEFAQPKELIHTVCQGCIFRVENEKREQIACSIDVDKLAPQKQEVYDLNGNSFYLMDGHMCLYKRGNGWLFKNKIDTKNAENLVKTEVSEAKITYSLVICCEEDFNEEDFKTTIEDIKNQNSSFSEILFIIYSKNYPKQSWMYNYISENFKGKWKITKSNSMEKADVFDEQIKNLKSIYYISINIKDRIKPDFLSQLKEAGNKKRFFVIEPTNDKNSFLCVMNFIHETFGGNKKAVTNSIYGEEIRTDNIVDKIKFVLKNNKKEDYITTYEKLGISP